MNEWMNILCEQLSNVLCYFGEIQSVVNRVKLMFCGMGLWRAMASLKNFFIWQIDTPIWAQTPWNQRYLKTNNNFAVAKTAENFAWPGL